MADTTAVKGETYLPNAVPDGEWAITVMDVDDEFVHVVRHHATDGVVGGVYRLSRSVFEALHVPCHRRTAWRAKLPDSGRE